MSVPKPEPTETTGKKPDIPRSVQIGDFIVARHEHSDWNRHIPWEDWGHAALVSGLNPLRVIETSGIILQSADRKLKKKEVREGVVEYEFKKPRTVIRLDGTKNKYGNLWLLEDLTDVMWLKPVFPDPLREIAKSRFPWTRRKKITESQARKRAVAFARMQIGEPFKLSPFKNAEHSATKWDENEWYCSLLIYKAYSRTVTNMRLESSIKPPGFFVTPEDLVDSRRSVVCHIWKNEKYYS